MGTFPNGLHCMLIGFVCLVVVALYVTAWPLIAAIVLTLVSAIGEWWWYRRRTDGTRG